VGLGSRRDIVVTFTNLADGAVSQVAFDLGAPGVMPVAITSDKKIRLRLYGVAGAQASDLSRTEDDDPESGIGVWGEFIYAVAGERKHVTPSTAWFNDDSPLSNTGYITVQNRHGSTQTITVTLTVVDIEV
jgi:hypothetical protein